MDSLLRKLRNGICTQLEGLNSRFWRSFEAGDDFDHGL
jgi:hypothetical protein